MPVPFARQDGQIGFPLDPIVLLRNPGFPRPGFPSFQRFSAVSTRSASRSSRRTWLLNDLASAGGPSGFRRGLRAAQKIIAILDSSGHQPLPLSVLGVR